MIRKPFLQFSLLKTCFKCGEERPTTDFHKHKQMPDGRLNKCRFCTVKDVAEWRVGRPPRVEEYLKSDKFKNRVYGYKHHNPSWTDSDRLQSRRSSSLKYVNKRRTQEQMLEITELDEFVFDEAYVLAKLRSSATGIEWNIDHIVPFNHKKACGLHVAYNLQVVPASWNFSKGNRNMNQLAGY